MGETLNIIFYACSDGTYEIRIKESWSGRTVSGRFIPPYTGRQLNALQKKLSKLDSHDYELHAIGYRLFASLCGCDTTGPKEKQVMNERLQSMLHDVIQRTVRRRGTVALMLEFGPGCDEFMRYPWELLHNGDHFLLVSGVFTLSRLLLRPDTPVGCELPVHPPFRVLYIAASPIDCVPLETERSFDAMQQALAPLIDTGQIFLDRLEPPTFSQLVRYLSSYGGAGMLNDRDTIIPCYVIHFDGHGAYGRLCSTDGCNTINEPDARKCRKCGSSLQRVKAQTYLCFCDDEGMNRFIDTQSLRDLLLSSDVRLAVLSACETAMLSNVQPSRVSEAAGHSAVDASLATALVTAQVPAVVAMPFSLQDDLSPTFMYHFYEALAEGRTLEEALSRSRQAMLPMQQKSWFIPVLYRLVAEDKEAPVSLLEVGETVGNHPLSYLEPPTNFIGRELELRELDELLTAAATGVQRPDVSGRLRITGTRRLHHIVVTGPAGIGKSALVYEAVRGNRNKFPGGVFGVMLQHGKSFGDAMLEIMRRLHLPMRNVSMMDVPHRTRLVQGTLRSLASRELPSLLLLDGFEAVQDQGELEMWLQFLCSLPQEVVVLLTSHTNPGNLVVSGSAHCRWYEYRLRKMVSADLVALARMLADESGLNQRIDLDDPEQQAILHEICNHLDGYPLGVELIFGSAREIGGKVYTPEAATRTLKEICEELRSMPLAGMQALLAISYQRLSPHARLLLGYLAAFTLSFQREQIMLVVHAMAAEPTIVARYADQTDTGPAELVKHWREARDELVQASLILFDGRSYTIHPQIGNFAMVNLSPLECQHIHRTIGRYYASLSAPGAEEWFAAFEHLEVAEDRQEAVQVAVRAALALRDSEHIFAMREILRRAVRYTEQEEMGGGQVYCCLAIVLCQQGFYAEAEDALRRSLAIHRQRNERLDIAQTLLELAELRYELGELLEADGYAREAQLLFQETDYAPGKARVHVVLGEVYQAQDRYAEALEHFETALMAFQVLDDQKGRASVLLGRGQNSVALGRYIQALHDYDEALRIFEREKAPAGRAWTLIQKASALIDLRKIEQAETICQEAYTFFLERNQQRSLAYVFRLLGDCYASRHSMQQAHEQYRQAYVLVSDGGNRIELARVLNALGMLLLDEDNGLEARGLFEQASKLAQERGARRVQSQALRGLGDCAQRAYQFEEAERLFRDALALILDIGSPAERSSLLVRQGTVCEEQKLYHEALDYWTQALKLDATLRYPPYSNLQQRVNVLVTEHHLEDIYSELRTRHSLVQGHA